MDIHLWLDCLFIKPMFPWRIDHLLVETRFETIFWNFYLFNDKNFIYKNQKKIITKSKPKRIMKNTKRKVSYDKSIAKSYSNEVCSYRNLEFFKNFNWWVPFHLQLGKGSCWEANKWRLTGRSSYLCTNTPSDQISWSKKKRLPSNWIKDF